MILQKKLLETDWQTLIVLDACRYDVFSLAIKSHAIDGDLIEANTDSCKTSEWYRCNWNKYNDNIVLITGHPQVRRGEFHKNFHATINVEGATPEWILPDRTFDLTIKAQSDYPDKKTMTHLIPPHLPFMGEKGKAFMVEVMGREKWSDQIGRRINGTTLYSLATEYGKKNGWDKLKEYYRENLDYVLNELLSYLNRLKYPVVITSDHGELLGEHEVYGHRGGRDILRRVPWFKVRGAG